MMDRPPRSGGAPAGTPSRSGRGEHAAGVRLSVVVVSDYEPGQQKTWQDERAALAALAAQDIDEPFDVILVESEEHRGAVTEKLERACPRLRIVFSGETGSGGLKDAGTRHARGEYVALLEADCVAERGWLRALVAALDEHPEFSVACGRTHYGDATIFHRCFGVLDRSFDDLGAPGETIHLSSNAALYRRRVLEAFPHPEAASVFRAARLRSAALRVQAHRIYFEPAAAVQHAFRGFFFVRDFRRNLGYADMMETRYRWLPRIAPVLGGRVWRDCATCLRVGPRRLRWYEWPLLGLLLAIVPWLHIPGALDAIRGRSSIAHSAFR
jgi:glycosyltransferase involved in cell wall biosynthesis